MKTNKKILVSVCVLAAVIALSVGGTFAMLTAKTDSKDNKFEHGVVNITIDEPGFNGDQDYDSENGYAKVVNIKNDSLDGTLNVVPAYVSVKLVVNWVDDAGNVLFAKVDFTPNYDANVWTEKDGIYYSKDLVAVDDEIHFMDTIKIKDFDKLPSGGHIEVNVLATGSQKSLL